jgi:hypothetical protein
MDTMDPIVVSLNTIINFSTLTIHPRNIFIQELLANYGCFQEKIETSRFAGNPRWNSNNAKKRPAQLHTRLERPKIGIQDSSKEAILKKELQGLLNKLTHNNFDVILKQIKHIFDMTYVHLFIDIIWSYLQKQPDFQGLYIQIIENIYQMLSEDSFIEIGTIWNNIWRRYMFSKEWKLSKELVETSHNYNDFCEYVKEKKRLVSTVQAWARLINLGIVHAEPFELLYDILYHIVRELNTKNKVDSMCIECYVEQSKEYYKTLSDNIIKRMPNNIDTLIRDMKDLELHKSCEFKINDFINLLIKNETPKINKIKSIYELEDDGL